jgi:hypothetical protein
MSYYDKYLQQYPELNEHEVRQCVDRADYSTGMSTDGRIDPKFREEVRIKYLEQAKENKLGAK